MKVAWSTCERELGGMKFIDENCCKSSFENFQKQLSLRRFYVKYLEKTVSIVYSYIT